MESSANKITLVKKELETLQQETDKLRSVAFLSTHILLCHLTAAYDFNNIFLLEILPCLGVNYIVHTDTIIHSTKCIRLCVTQC